MQKCVCIAELISRQTETENSVSVCDEELESIKWRKVLNLALVRSRRLKMKTFVTDVAFLTRSVCEFATRSTYSPRGEISINLQTFVSLFGALLVF